MIHPIRLETIGGVTCAHSMGDDWRGRRLRRASDRDGPDATYFYPAGELYVEFREQGYPVMDSFLYMMKEGIRTIGNYVQDIIPRKASDPPLDM